MVLDHGLLFPRRDLGVGCDGLQDNWFYFFAYERPSRKHWPFLPSYAGQMHESPPDSKILRGAQAKAKHIRSLYVNIDCSLLSCSAQVQALLCGHNLHAGLKDV